MCEYRVVDMPIPLNSYMNVVTQIHILTEIHMLMSCRAHVNIVKFIHEIHM